MNNLVKLILTEKMGKQKWINDFSSHRHHDWIVNRVDFITKKYKKYFENSKTLVNMGAMWGDLSFLVRKKFPHIDCINEEGNLSNLKLGRERYPEMKWEKINYETCDLNSLSDADIVFNMGLFYHLSKEKASDVLTASIRRTKKILFFETEVIDCDNENCFIETPHMVTPLFKEIGTDGQGLVPYEIKPSIPYVNNILKKLNCTYEYIESPELNGNNHTYDWKITNTKNYTQRMRKFWVINKY